MTTITSQSSLIANVAGIIRRVAKIKPEVSIGAETRLVEDLAIDSLDLVAIVLQIQEDFDVVIDEDLVQHLRCVCDLAAQVAERAPAVAH
ncbi:MAG: acyl carrier protein [Isosphaeraceae bacterium]